MTTFHFRQGDSGPSVAMVTKQATLEETAVLMAIEYVQTRSAASRIYYAEKGGLNRPLVIMKASRRMDDFARQHIPRMEGASMAPSPNKEH